MPATIHVWDEQTPGTRFPAAALDLQHKRITLRELIQARIEREVELYNQSQPEAFRGLIQPEESEQMLNGVRSKVRRPLDAKTQFERACRSFENNGFLVLINGCQVIELDDLLELRAESEVEFVKLVPLIGG